MSYIYWNDDYLVGVDVLDDQHKSLFALMNEVLKHFEYEEGHKEFFNNLNLLIKYAEKHFREEEKFMEKIKFPHLKDHQKKHEGLFYKIFNLAAEDVKNNYDTRGLVKFLKDWLCVHIKHEDMIYRDFNKTKISQN